MRLQRQRARNLSPRIQRRHQLRNTVDQNVFVMQRRQALDRGHNRDLCPIMLIVQDALVRPRGERKHRVFHARHIVLGQSRENIAHEEIARGMSMRIQLESRWCLCHISALLPSDQACLIKRANLTNSGFVFSLTLSLKLSTGSVYDSTRGLSWDQSRFSVVPESPYRGIRVTAVNKVPIKTH